MTSTARRIVAVALNPAVDRVLEAPQLTLGAHQVVRLLTRYPGGKAVNVAKALSLLEVPCVLTGLVGQGEHEYFAQDVAGSLVRMEMLAVPGHTRENITLIDPVARNETHLRDRGFPVSAGTLAHLRQKLGELAGRDTVFVFSGSLPPGVSQADLSDLLGVCRAAGSRLAIDASGEALSTAVDAEPWLIKPNQQELEELVGHNLHNVEELIAAGRDLAQRIELVLVSHGAGGVYLFAGQAGWHGRCEVPVEEVTNTVGCGDTLLAGFLAGLHRGWEYTDALKLAVASAAGTAVSLTPRFERGRVDAFLERAKVEKV